jgi:guanylate kinase
MKKAVLFIVSAPSGGGKTTLVHEAIKRLAREYSIEPVISYTTRAMREGEVAGRDYYFISREDFVRKMESGFFLETTVYNNHHYGAPAVAIDALNAGKSQVLVINIDGAKAAHQAHPDAVCIWINAPSLEVLRQRLIKRGETPHQIDARLAVAKEEIYDAEHHHKRLFRYHLVNDVFDQSVSELVAILKSEMGS